MKALIQTQYDSIKKTILANIRTIKDLIDQTGRLEELVNTMEGKENKELKKSLQKELKKIENLIEELVTQTQHLFEEYNAFVETVYQK